MSGSRRHGRRAMRSARAWRRDRMIERQVARRVEEDARAGVPIRPEVATPAPLLVAPGRAVLLNARHIVPAPDTPLSRHTARGR